MSGNPTSVRSMMEQQPPPTQVTAPREPGWTERNAPWILGGAALIGTALSLRESRKNREWQERMANTAHQREVQDLIAAGINPMLSARGGGAETPSGDKADWSESVRQIATALQLQQMKADIAKTQAETVYTRVQAADIESTAPSRYSSLAAAAELAELDLNQRRQLFDTVIAKAKADLDVSTASARGIKARAALDELDKARAMNAEQLERWLKTGTPGVRLFLELLRGVRR